MSRTVELTGDGRPHRAASALSAGLGVKPCKHCGSERYIIKMLYKGYRNNVAVVECGDCGGDTTPVVLDYFMPEAECYTKCREAWNAANETPNALAQADAACGVSPGAMGYTAGGNNGETNAGPDANNA